MAATRKTNIKKQAEAAASKPGTRARIHKLTVSALREGKLTRAEISGVVHDVLEGTSKAVKDSMPSSRNSSLRQVFDGLEDGMRSVASAGTGAARSVRRRGKAIATHAVPAAKKRLVEANNQFLHAVTLFAKRTSSEVGDELNLLVQRARRSGKEVSAAAKSIRSATDGKIGVMTREAAESGMSLARRAAKGIALAASGLLEGLGEVISPRRTPPASRATRNPKPNQRKRTARRAKPAGRRSK